IAAVAAAGVAAALEADFERGEAGEMADAFGGSLIDALTDADIGAGGFDGVSAGEERGAGAGVVAGAVAFGEAVFLGEAGEERDLGFELGEGLHRGAELEGGAFAGGTP